MTFRKSGQCANGLCIQAQNMLTFLTARNAPAQLTSLHINTKVCVVLSHKILSSVSRNNQAYQDSAELVYPLGLPSLTHGITYS